VRVVIGDSLDSFEFHLKLMQSWDPFLFTVLLIVIYNEVDMAKSTDVGSKVVVYR